MTNDEDNFATSDYKQAASFMALGHEIIGVDQTLPRLRFLFKRNPQFEQDYRDYMNGNLRIEPNLLWEKFGAVKEMLFAVKDQKINI
jgi:hypothetical protein